MLAISRFSASLAVFIFNAGVAVAEPVTVAIAKARSNAWLLGALANPSRMYGP